MKHINLKKVYYNSKDHFKEKIGPYDKNTVTSLEALA